MQPKDMGRRVLIAAGIGLFALLVLSVGHASAEEAGAARQGPIAITGAWVRAAPPGAPVAAGYLAIRNDGAGEERLRSITADFAERVEIHEMASAGGVMTMRPLDGGLAIPAGGTAELAPGGLHLMFTGLSDPLVPGTIREVVLDFADAGPVRIVMPVRTTPPDPAR